MSRPRREAPWVIRALLGFLPEQTRRDLSEPLEVTVAEALDDAGARGEGAYCWALMREVTALIALLFRELREGGPRGAPREGLGDMVGQDIRFAFRGLRRSPGVSLVSIATLALGIGAATAIVSLVDGVLLRNLSHADPDRVLYLGETTPEGGYRSSSYENFRDWQASGIFASVGGTIGNSVSVTGDGLPERIRGEFVTASYFDVIGVGPVMGRAIAPGEDVPNGPRVAVLSWGWWQQRFGGDPGVLGRTIVLNNEPHTVVGIMPAGFRSPWDTPQAWVSLQTAPRSLDRAGRNFQALIARMRPGQTAGGATASLEALATGLAERYPEANRGWGVWAQPLGPFLSSRNRPFILGLAAAVGLLLLIVCANVANLQLARAAARRPEMAVRTALGGGRLRLVRLLLVENAILFLVGGVAGLGVAWLSIRGLLVLEPAYTDYYDVRLNPMAATVGMALALLTGVVFGVAPALEAFRSAPAGALKDGDRRGGTSRGSQRFRSGLVVAQLALSVSLLVGAGLLTRTMSALMGVTPGFDQTDLLTLEFRLPQNRFGGEPERIAFFDELLREVRGVSGAEAVGLASDLPFSGNGGSMRLLPEGSATEWEQAPVVRSNAVSPGYRETMEIPLLEGRDLQESDALGDPFAVLVSRSLAERYFGGGDALGKHLYVTPDRSVSATIVGIVGDVQTSLTQPPEPYVYVSYRQSPPLFTSVAVRARGEPMSLAAAVRDAVWRVDADQPVWEVMPITERMANSASRTRFNAVLVAAFAATALLLACLGLYGVMTYTIRQRERELGVRLALGASPGAVMHMVLQRGLLLIGGGLAVGAVVAWWLARLLEAMLFGVTARDPLTFAGAVVALGLVGALSTYLPARRTLGLDPAQALHDG